MKKYSVGIILLFTALLVTAYPATGENTLLSLRDVVEMTLSRNPALEAASASVEAAEARVPATRALPDPILSLGLMSVPVDTFDLDQEPMTQVTIGVSQTIPFPGKLRRGSEASGFGLKAEEFRDIMTRQELVFAARAGFHELVYLDRAIEVTAVNKSLMTELARIAQTRFEVGRGIQQDPIRAQVELSRLIDEQIGYEQARVRTAAELIRLMNSEPASPVQVRKPVMERPPVPGREEMIEKAIKNSPALLIAKSMADQADAAYRLSRLSSAPDLTVGLSYGIREDGRMDGEKIERPDFLSASVSLPVPVWKSGKQDRITAEMEAGKRRAGSMAIDAQARLIARVDILLAELERLDEQIVLLETGILPQAGLSLESARSAYTSGRADFMTLVNANITLYQMELRLARLQSDYFRTTAELEMTTGRPVEEIMEELES